MNMSRQPTSLEYLTEDQWINLLEHLGKLGRQHEEAARITAIESDYQKRLGAGCASRNDTSPCASTSMIAE